MESKIDNITLGKDYTKKFTSSGSRPPGIKVPSFEQKQYGSAHSLGLHFTAKSIGGSVIGAGAMCKHCLHLLLKFL